MAGPTRSFAPRSWLRLPARTARLRLTLLYSGGFLLLGTAVITITFVLAASGSPIQVSVGSAAPRATVHVQTSPSGAHGSSVTALPSAIRPPGDPLLGVRDVLRQQHSSDLSRLLAVSWLVLAVTAIISAVLGWFASGRVLRPLREMADTARTISAGNLSRRLALAGPDDEFKALGDTLDDLLARLEASFEAQRRFVANASHELRTPLTLERTLLQVTLADPDASAATLRATCEELLATGQEQEQLLEALLTLASSERGLERREPVDLAKLAEHALRTPRPEIELRSLQMTTELAHAPATGDPALIERLIANLIDNAVRYNNAGGQVEVHTATAPGHSIVSVTNTGPVVAPDELERLFEPFRRLGDRPTAGADGGHGLGLSIVRAIANAHGATITALAQPQGGLALTVSFARSESG